MRLGEVMIFNLWINHCCTNPSSPEVYIFSAYVADKTVKFQAKDSLGIK